VVFKQGKFNVYHPTEELTTNQAENMKKTIGIGLMTGTSLDGIDMACVEFSDGGYKLIRFEGVDFSDELRLQLTRAHELPPSQFFHLENVYSEYLASAVNSFLKECPNEVSFLGIHGQTILHDPSQSLTYQMLNGGLVAAKTGLQVVCDFRRTDVANGGQGAPLVPIGDEDLFPDYSACLNLGGFANISANGEGKRIAFDICPCNMPMNEVSRKLGHSYDEDGKLAASGSLQPELLDKLNSLNYYRLPPPKSLGREWYQQEMLPLLRDHSEIDLLRTLCEHLAYQISGNLPSEGKVLITGGGAHNDFLISLIKEKSSCEMVVPETELVDGKEALIFAYLAYLRLNGRVNVRSSITGGSADLSSGAVYLPH